MDIINQYGADALRFSLMNSTVVRADALKFSDDSVKDAIKSLLLPLWNAYSFFVTYANIDGYTPSTTPFNEIENSLDRWVISITQGFVKEVTTAFDAYDIQGGCAAMVTFVDNLNNWYIRRSRRRFWRSENDGDKKQAYDTLYSVLMTVVKVCAPIVPFITEEIYSNLRTEDMKESVHLCDFPVYNEAERDLSSEKQMHLAMQSIVMGRSLRSSHNLKTRQPLKALYLVDRSAEDREILTSMTDIICDELNVKKIFIQEDESNLVSYSAKANFKVLGKKLGKNMKEVAALIQKFTSAEIASILDGNTKSVDYSAGSIELSEDDLMIQRSEQENVKVLNEGELTVAFDTTLTPELINEGLARDIIRAIQTMRKSADFDVADHISVMWEGGSAIDTVFDTFKDYVCKETLCDILTKGSVEAEEIEVGDEKIKLALTRLDA
jgi:isoleucyl-tRNA synthetase